MYKNLIIGMTRPNGAIFFVHRKINDYIFCANHTTREVFFQQRIYISFPGKRRVGFRS